MAIEIIFDANCTWVCYMIAIPTMKTIKRYLNYQELIIRSSLMDCRQDLNIGGGSIPWVFGDVQAQVGGVEVAVHILVGQG